MLALCIEELIKIPVNIEDGTVEGTAFTVNEKDMAAFQIRCV